MKQSTVIKILAGVIIVMVLGICFVLFTDNSISNAIFTTTATTTTTSPKPQMPQKPTEKPMDLMNTDLSQYVTLGQYKDLAVDFELTETEYASGKKYIEENINVLLIGDELIEKIYEGTITEEVIFSFNFTGYLNGVAFDNGAAENTYAYIKGDDFYIVGGGTFIDGFAQGILGAEVGSEFEINVKFPDNYGSEELKGKDAVFAIKINHIVDKIDFTDEWISKISEGKYDTTAKYVEETLERLYRYNNVGKIQNKVIDLSTIIEVPQEEIDYYYSDLRYTIEGYAVSYGMTYETFLSSGYGSYFWGLADDKAVREYARNIVIAELVSLSIAKAENMIVSDEEYEAYVENMKSQYGITEEEIFERYTKEKICEEILMQHVTEFIKENNKFAIKIVPDKTESK